ncbi:MAG: hypothetical protein ACRDTI_20805 [Mycobacterium sp.]
MPRIRFFIGHARRIPGGVDSDGYSVAESWGDVEVVGVYGWEPLSSSMPVGAELTHRVLTSKMLLAPDPERWSPGDRVWLAGIHDPDDATKFIPDNPDTPMWVDQDVRDCNTGPYRYTPGAGVVIAQTRG